MTKFYQEDGSEIEAFTQEELNDKVNEVSEAKAQEITDLQTQLSTISEELTQLKDTDKGKNMANMRNKIEGLEKLKDELEGKIGSAVSGLKQLISDKDLDVNIKTLAEGDEEIAKKIKFHYDSIVKTEDDEKIRREKLGQAYILATGTKKSDVLNKVIGGAGAPNIGAVGGKETFSPELVGLGAKLGLTPKDFEKYGGKQRR